MEFNKYSDLLSISRKVFGWKVHVRINALLSAREIISIMKYIFFVSLISLFGCITTDFSKLWISEGKTSEETKKDYSNCKRLAHELMEPDVSTYRLIEDPNNFRRNRELLLQITDLCMEDKGYVAQE